MKKIVFIGGTSHSGSTLLDLMIATNPKAYSVGEVISLFRPRKAHHFDPICGCGVRNCAKWAGIRESGERRLYENIFRRNPDIDIIVDSSKDPVWIKDQLSYLRGYDYNIFHFLIWKTPTQLALSLYKRDKLHTWKNLWIRYHLRYLSVVPNPISIRYSELTKNPALMLESTFEKIGSDYVEGQEEYWRKKHHNLFGSASARIHLHEIGSPEHDRLKEYVKIHQTATSDRSNLNARYYREIRYRKSDESILPPPILKQIEGNPHVKNLIDILSSYDLTSPSRRVPDSLKDLPKPDLLWCIKLRTKRYYQYLEARAKMARSGKI